MTGARTTRLIAGVDELGGIVVTPRDPERRGALVCIRSTDAPALVAALAGETGSSPRSATATCASRAHAYNTEEDIDAVLAALAHARCDLLAIRVPTCIRRT